MKDINTRIMNAIASGSEVMDDYSAIWNGKAAIVNKKDALDDKKSEIEDLEDLITDSTGITTGKRTSKNDAAKTAWKVAKAVTVFARDTGNTELEAEIDFSWSQIRFAKDQDFIDNLSLIYNRSHANETALDTGEYLDITLIGVLLTQKDSFVTNRPKPKGKRSTNKAINAQIDVKVKEMMVIKNDLLDLFVQFSDSDVLFYEAVNAAFEVDMTGIRHVALRVRYSDSATGVRLKGVSCMVLEEDLVKSSSRKGVVDFKNNELGQGNYIVVSQLLNYIENRKVDVGIVTGKMRIFDINLVKGALVTGLLAGGAFGAAQNLPNGTMFPPVGSGIELVCFDPNVELIAWFARMNDNTGSEDGYTSVTFSKDEPFTGVMSDVGFGGENLKLMLKNTNPTALGHYSFKVIFA